MSFLDVMIERPWIEEPRIAKRTRDFSSILKMSWFVIFLSLFFREGHIANLTYIRLFSLMYWQYMIIHMNFLGKCCFARRHWATKRFFQFMYCPNVCLQSPFCWQRFTTNVALMWWVFVWPFGDIRLNYNDIIHIHR